MLTHTLRIINSVLQGYIKPPVLDKATKTVTIPFRCSLLDIDPYMHMNNSKYLFLAELARWRTFPATGVVHKAMSKEGFFFILAATQVEYQRQITPFEKFVISTSVTMGSDDKWLYYHHHFLQHPDDVKPGNEPMTFAKVKAKSVLKQANGKTIKPSTLVEESELIRDWIVESEDDGM
ncbi:unnamed protein product [Cylindrotheca closterium]|uniref:Thioesterase domain-containing protein n=1 Tax=Cylindrotheca closterium TaxID=2856 RepID=A0AAD2FYA9_9STRA|nr:unnamed protein product [Cylindrotheca closterium]